MEKRTFGKVMAGIAGKTVDVARNIGAASHYWTAYMFRYPPVVSGKVVDKSYGSKTGRLYFTVRGNKPWELSPYGFALETRGLQSQPEQALSLEKDLTLEARVEVRGLCWLPLTAEYKVIQPSQVKVLGK